MNCFNIRELQGILKRKFFTDLVNTSDSHKAFESTLINMRHKNNMSNILMYDQSLLYNFDLTNTSKYKNFSFSPGEIYTYNPISFFLSSPKPSLTILSNSFSSIKTTYVSLLKDFTGFIYVPTTTSLITFINSFYYIRLTVTNSLYYNLYLPLNFSHKLTTTTSTNTGSLNLTQNYYSNTINYSTFNNLQPFNFSENTSSWRFNRYSYPLISYDFKTGNYLGIWDQLYPSLTLAFIEQARGIRKAPWFFSDQYTDALKNNYNLFLTKFTTQLNLKLADIDS